MYYGPHDISKAHAQGAELARCKTCGLVITNENLRAQRKVGYIMYLLAAVIALASYFASRYVPGIFAAIGGLLVTVLIVFAGANMDAESIIGMHARGPK